MRHWTTSLWKPSIPFAVKKRPEMNFIFEYLNKKLHNSNITPTLIDTRLSTLTIDGKLEIKYPVGKASYRIKGNNALQSCKSKTPTSSKSFSSPLDYETSIIKSNMILLETPIALYNKRWTYSTSKSFLWNLP